MGMPVLKKKIEDLSQAERTSSNFPKLDETGHSVEEAETPNQEIAPPNNSVRSKEAARKNILAYVGKMKAKEDAEGSEEGGAEKKTNGQGCQVNGNGNVGSMQKEAEEEKSASSVENQLEEELRPNGQEMIEKSNGSNVNGEFCDGQVAVKMRAEKCKEFNGDNDSLDGANLDDQNLS